MVKLIIDYREKKILNYFKEHKHKEYIEKKNLLIGDVIFEYENKKILTIERKTIKDLISSITDGRYKEQKYRLLKNNDKNNIFLLLEGEIEEIKFGNIKKKNIFGAIINTIFRDEINIYKAFDIEETCFFLETILNKLIKKEIKNLNKLFRSNNEVKIENNDETEKSYCETLKLSKKANLTPKVFNELILLQIPGISKMFIKGIFSKYKSIKDLILIYMDENLTKKEKETLLKDIKIKTENKKERKIGPVISKRIYEFLIY